MAIRLSKYFSTTPTFWLELQAQSEIAVLQSDKKFTAQINKIPKAQKPTGKFKTSKKTTKTLAEKRKTAAKVPGAKKARGRKAKKK